MDCTLPVMTCLILCHQLDPASLVQQGQLCPALVVMLALAVHWVHQRGCKLRWVGCFVLGSAGVELALAWEDLRVGWVCLPWIGAEVARSYLVEAAGMGVGFFL